MVFVCWVHTVLPASVGPTARPCSDAVPMHGKGCAYQPPSARLVRSCTPGKPKISSYSSCAETPTGLPDDLASLSWIQLKTSPKCWFGMVSMQGQQETSRHCICAPAAAPLLLLHLFVCWYPLFQASRPREGLMIGFCCMAKHLPGGLGDFWVHELFLRREGCKAAALGPMAIRREMMQPSHSPHVPPPAWCCPNRSWRGMNPSPLFASQEPLLLQRAGFLVSSGKGEEWSPGMRISPAPLVFPPGRCWGEIVAHQRKRNTSVRGGYRNALQSSSPAANNNPPLSEGDCRESSLFGRGVWRDLCDG